MKYIYTWNQGTNMYDIRLATKDDQILINKATKLLAECKQIYNQIINEANALYNGDLDDLLMMRLIIVYKIYIISLI